MTVQTADFDVISQPAMPPPPPQPVVDTQGMAKWPDPRHNPARGDQR